MGGAQRRSGPMGGEGGGAAPQWSEQLRVREQSLDAELRSDTLGGSAEHQPAELMNTQTSPCFGLTRGQTERSRAF